MVSLSLLPPDFSGIFGTSKLSIGSAQGRRQIIHPWSETRSCRYQTTRGPPDESNGPEHSSIRFGLPQAYAQGQPTATYYFRTLSGTLHGLLLRLCLNASALQTSKDFGLVHHGTAANSALLSLRKWIFFCLTCRPGRYSEQPRRQ